MRIRPRRRMTNRTHGEHLSGKGGTSIEFSDFRDYVAGDDLRHVDWNIFSRLHRPYVKQFRYEEQMCVVILLDASTSMTFDGKFERARQIAAAFALMGLFSLEPVSIYSCQPHGEAHRCFARRARAGQAGRAYSSFSKNWREGATFRSRRLSRPSCGGIADGASRSCFPIF